MLRAPGRRRERILLYGHSGSGKSTAWLTVAEWLHKTRSEAVVHAIDTDRTWDDMAPLDGHLDKVVDAYLGTSWEQIREAIRKLSDIEREDDWLVVDMASRCWDRAQEGYFTRAFGKDLDEFFAIGNAGDRARTMGGDYGANWQAINKMYGTLTTLVMNRWPGHVLACTPAQKIWEANDTNEQKIQFPEFGRLGFKPQGQKDLPHQFRTILFLAQAPTGWRWTTAKERNPAASVEGDEGHRGYRTGETMRDFVVDYLMKVGGWKP